ncbi:hypothetical protein, partial [Enterococcus casseliflavus]|uniref:hypothetical protein n=1 Tax=Enterococcus casseliflavus TaxID=37734 RepID=UPI003D1111EC
DESGAALYTDQDLRLRVAAAIQEWIETEEDDLDSGENYADRLFAMMIGIADDNQDGELDEDEAAVLDAALEIAWDYLSAKGATDDDI